LGFSGDLQSPLTHLGSFAMGSSGASGPLLCVLLISKPRSLAVVGARTPHSCTTRLNEPSPAIPCNLDQPIQRNRDSAHCAYSLKESHERRDPARERLQLRCRRTSS